MWATFNLNYNDLIVLEIRIAYSQLLKISSAH